jgi:hypothetical protein
MTTSLNSPRSGNLDAYAATAGTLVAAKRDGSAKGCTLANGTTYYFPLGGSHSGPGLVSNISIMLSWASAVAAVFTLEATDFPGIQDGEVSGPSDTTDYATSGWTQINPLTAYVPVSGSGNSASAATVTAGGSAAGTALFEISGATSRRYRIKAVVTTGGLVRCGSAVKGA